MKPRLLGHWGTTPGLNFIYAHMNRVIRSHDLDALFVCGPGHGGPGVVANTYLEGTYSEVYPAVSRDEVGLAQLFRQFSFPGGIPSHVAPETPGSIHEGGEPELTALMRGSGYEPYYVVGDERARMHALMAETLDRVVARIHEIQRDARERGVTTRPRWPMIILASPKGWTGPKEVDGKPTEGSFRSHQVPLAGLAQHPEHLRQLETWLLSYRPHELFDDQGALRAELAALAPVGDRRMSANPHANGGLLLRDLVLPDFRRYAIRVERPGAVDGEATRVLGTMLRDVMRLNESAANFRVMGPDETNSNRLGALFEVTNRTSEAEILATDDHVARDGRVMEVLSEHLCQGWLEGYLLTGRHGFFSCYEAFIHIVDSMFNQHAK